MAEHAPGDDASATGLNFLCLVVDQMRADHLGCAGNPVIRTPHLDALAASGVRFDRAYCNNPLCMPGRATLATGLTPRGHGVRTNGIPLDRKWPTIMQALAESGYQTHSVGKIHLTPFGVPKGLALETLRPEEWPECSEMWRSGRLTAAPTPYYGFQGVEMILGHGSWVAGDYVRWLKEQDPAAERLLGAEAGRPTPHRAEQAWHSALPEELHYNRWVADRSIAFLEQQTPERPFFLWCSFPDPHHPYCPPQPWASMYDPAEVVMPTRRQGELETLAPFYRQIHDEPLPLSGRSSPTRMADEQLREILALTYGMVSHVDEQIGRVLEALERRGLRKNTVICFLSDHGDMMGDHWMINKGPFHFEGLLRVPCLWSIPGGTAGGTAPRAPASLLDFAPTVLDLAGVPIPEGATPAVPETEQELPPWPGRSLAPVLRGDAESVQDSVVVENDEDYLGLRLRTLVTERYKLTVYAGQPHGELFDLEEDPGELQNRWEDPDHRETRSELTARLLERLVETDNRLPRRLCHA